MIKVERIASTHRNTTIGIVHLGLGAFHRAHQALYLERNLQRHDGGPWGLCSANLRSGRGLVQTLANQQGRYHVAEYGDRDHLTLREVGAIREVLFAGDGGADREQLLARLSSASVRIVTLTVTEKGYCLNPATGELLTQDPGIAADIARPEQPRTAPGLLLEALRRRRAAGVMPFTVLSCDNMPNNGQRTRQAVLALACMHDMELAEWIEDNVAFPASMVDRIVPAMDADAFERLGALGCDDPAAVACEAFSQWVVEEHFPSGRPDWELEGVQMVADVHPFETMKLRLLNGSHSLLAYVGRLMGHDTVAEAMADLLMARLVRRYMQSEAAASLAMPNNVDLQAYATDLQARFANNALQHRLQQIAMDGSQKLPQRWLAGIEELLERGRDIACSAFGVAAWMVFTEQQGRELDDPLRDRLAALPGGPARVDACLALGEIFPASLVHRAAFREAVRHAHHCIITHGVRTALTQLLDIRGD